MYCKYCGNPNPDDAAFCGKCGKQIKGQSVPKTEKNKSGKGKIVIAAVLVLVVACVSIFFVKNSANKKKIEEAIRNDWTQSSQDVEMPAYLEKIDEMSSYEIVKVENDKGLYTATVKVTGVDLGKALKEVDYEDFPTDEAKMNEYLIGIIEKSESFHEETEIYVEKTDDGFAVHYSEEFVDAMSGKVYSYAQDVVEEIIEEQK